MSNHLTTNMVWKEIEDNMFGVLGMVSAKGEARTVGIVYVVHERQLYIGTFKKAWKARHIAQNGHVSMTIPIAKRIPLMPWIKIPAATITFAGKAELLENNQISSEVLEALYRGVAKDDAQMAASCVIKVKPVGDFITYGVGISLMEMRDPEKARGRAAVM